MIDVYKTFIEMLKINTTNSLKNETEFILYVKDILDKYNITNEIYYCNNRGNIVATINEGHENKIALISHCDVAEIENQEWKYDPFSATVEENKIYSRGTIDTKHLCAIHLAIFIELSQTNYNGEVKLIITADEENGSLDGMSYLAQQIELDGYLIFNEGGGFCLQNTNLMTITIGEKTRCYVDLKSDNLNECEKDFITLVNNISELNNRKQNNCNDQYRQLTNSIDDMIKYNQTNNFKFNNYTANDANSFSFNILIQFLPHLKNDEINEILSDMVDNTNFSIIKTKIEPGFSFSDDLLMKTVTKNINEFGLQNYSLFETLALGNTDGRFLSKNNIIGFSPLLNDIPLEKVTKLIHQKDEYITKESFEFCYNVLRNLIKEIGESNVNN